MFYHVSFYIHALSPGMTMESMPVNIDSIQPRFDCSFISKMFKNIERRSLTLSMDFLLVPLFGRHLL